MLTLTLRYIAHVNFQKSELTNFEELIRSKKIRLGKDDVAALVSLAGNQIIFVYGFDELGQNGQDVRVLRSQRWRITGGTSWNPLMLSNYAADVGIKLAGLKRFEEHYARLKRERDQG